MFRGLGGVEVFRFRLGVGERMFSGAAGIWVLKVHPVA